LKQTIIHLHDTEPPEGIIMPVITKRKWSFKTQINYMVKY
jgi:hypothetical protein